MDVCCGWEHFFGFGIDKLDSAEFAGGPVLVCKVNGSMLLMNK